MATIQKFEKAGEKFTNQKDQEPARPKADYVICYPCDCEGCKRNRELILGHKGFNE